MGGFEQVSSYLRQGVDLDGLWRSLPAPLLHNAMIS